MSIGREVVVERRTHGNRRLRRRLKDVPPTELAALVVKDSGQACESRSEAGERSSCSATSSTPAKDMFSRASRA